MSDESSETLANLAHEERRFEPPGISRRTPTSRRTRMTRPIRIGWPSGRSRPSVSTGTPSGTRSSTGTTRLSRSGSSAPRSTRRTTASTGTSRTVRVTRSPSTGSASPRTTRGTSPTPTSRTRLRGDLRRLPAGPRRPPPARRPGRPAPGPGRGRPGRPAGRVRVGGAGAGRPGGRAAGLRLPPAPPAAAGQRGPHPLGRHRQRGPRLRRPAAARRRRRLAVRAAAAARRAPRATGPDRRACSRRPWRCGAGRPLADYADEPWAEAEIARLTELRAVARERLLAARLALRRGGAARRRTSRRWSPRSRCARSAGGCWRSRCTAAHRQADALSALRRARTTLADELGVDPGPALRELESQVLAQSPVARTCPQAAARRPRAPAAARPPAECRTT